MLKITNDRATRKVLIDIDNSINIHRSGIRKSLFEMGRENVKHVRNLMTKEKKTGRTYTYKGKPHIASAPGQAPAVMSGKLLKSVGYKVRGWHQMEFGDRAFYGKFLEFGTSKMESRPHIEKTVDDREINNQVILLKNADRGVKG